MQLKTIYQIQIANNKKNIYYYLLCMHAVFMGMITPSAEWVTPEVVDEIGWAGHRHATSHEAGTIDTANVACSDCSSDI